MADLIDRVALMKTLYNDCRCMNSHFLRAVRLAPTIKRKRGLWIEDRTEIICSACMWVYDSELMLMSHNGRDKMGEAFSYCPHCGARMDMSCMEGGDDEG